MEDNFGGYSMDAFGGYGADLGGYGSDLGATIDYDPFGGGFTGSSLSSIGDTTSDWGSGMDAFGGYGTDFGLANSGTSDYFGTDYDGSGFSSVGGNYGTQETSNSFLEEISRFSKTPIGQMLSLTPIGKGLMVSNAVNAASKGNFGPAVGQAVGAATGNGLIGQVANIGTQAAQGKNVSGAVGSTIGGVFGSQATGSPIGGMIGSQIGGMMATQGNPSQTTNVGNQGMDFGGALANFVEGSLTNMASRDIGRNVSSMQANSPQVSLESLYGPDSPYAAQLRQQLERKDAAAGRRSQYGPREVELQARLADMYSRAAPNFMQANVMNQNAIAQQQALQAQRRNQTLASIYGLARSSGVLRGIGNTFQDAGINSNLNYINNIVPDNSLNGYISDSYREYM